MGFGDVEMGSRRNETTFVTIARVNAARGRYDPGQGVLSGDISLICLVKCLLLCSEPLQFNERRLDPEHGSTELRCRLGKLMSCGGRGLFLLPKAYNCHLLCGREERGCPSGSLGQLLPGHSRIISEVLSERSSSKEGSESLTSECGEESSGGRCMCRSLLSFLPCTVNDLPSRLGP